MEKKEITGLIPVTPNAIDFTLQNIFLKNRNNSMTDHIISDRVNGSVADIQICEICLIDFKFVLEHFVCFQQ